MGKMTMTGRLIPLNKEYPNIPKYDKFRPIVVLSPLVKCMEGMIVRKLKWYCR
jgi:hypothetical protein